MALIVFVMSIINQAFSGNASALSQLEEIGDLDERVASDAMSLAENITVTNQQSREFIQDGLRTGTVNGEEASVLRDKYAAICAAAADLEMRLRAIEPHVQYPRAQRVLGRSLRQVERLKSYSATLLDLLHALMGRDNTP